MFLNFFSTDDQIRSQRAARVLFLKFCTLWQNDNFVQNEDATEGDAGFKWSFSAFCSHFEANGLDVSLMWAKIYDVVIKSLLSIEQKNKLQLKQSNVHRNNCYELLGYDILLDQNLK